METRKLEQSTFNFISLYVAFLVVLPILNQYSLGILTFEMLFAALGIVLVFLKKGKFKDDNRIGLFLFLYIMYVCFSTIVNSILLDSELLQIIMRLILFMLLTFETVVVIPEVCDFDKIMKIYSDVVIILSFLIIIQFAIYQLSGKATILLIPGLDLNYSDLDSTQYTSYYVSRVTQGWYYRPSAVFIEPAHFAQYTLPWLFLTVCKRDALFQRKKKCILFIVSIGLVLSASSLGILGLVLAWSIYLTVTLRHLSARQIFRLIEIILAIIVVIILALKISSVSFYLNMKIDEMFNERDQSNSFTMRMLRGWNCYKQYGIINQMFGCGYGNILSYNNHFQISTQFDTNMADLSYMSGLFTMLCDFGAFGTLIYAYTIFAKFYVKNKQQIAMLVCIVFLMSTTAVFNTPIYYLMVTIFILLKSCNTQAGAFHVE